MLACSLVRSALASASVRPISASVLAIAGRRKVTNSAVFTSPLSVLASSRTVHCILPALVVRHQSGRSAMARQATRPRFLPLPLFGPFAQGSGAEWECRQTVLRRSGVVGYDPN